MEVAATLPWISVLEAEPMDAVKVDRSRPDTVLAGSTVRAQSMLLFPALAVTWQKLGMPKTPVLSLSVPVKSTIGLPAPPVKLSNPVRVSELMKKPGSGSTVQLLLSTMDDE